jgi:P-type conjugative transfer protein TrbG
MLGYQAQLGHAWFHVEGVPVYRPWDLFAWWYHYEAYAPLVFDKAGSLAGASGFFGCATAIAGSLWRARQSRHVTTYGSARWASIREIERAGLCHDAGIFLGTSHGRYLRHDGPEHIMAFAPTRSGKGVGLVVPALLSWPGSVIIHDIKGENWHITSGWRSRFSHALLFNPTDRRSARYNPLIEVRRGEQEVRDVQNIADILVDPVITTDRRVYHLELQSTARTAMAALSWTYPQDELIAIKRQNEVAQAAAPVASGLAVERLNFRFAITGDKPDWRPLRAFDDGLQTFIEFPASVAVGEAPPLFVLGARGEAELVNYRMSGRFYVVDRIFAAAELRLGTKHQSIVRITRMGSGRLDRRSGAGS